MVQKVGLNKEMMSIFKSEKKDTRKTHRKGFSFCVCVYWGGWGSGVWGVGDDRLWCSY